MLLHCLSVLVNEDDELLSHSHDHVANVFLPGAQIVLSLLVIQNRLRCEFAHFVEFFQRGNVALVDVLDVLFVYEAGKTLEALLL